uniref:Exostosin GT47 domain-containing protein n=1 Tax=Electrophorus electricus TaxID=8005 RepID=A0AAY5EE66_ELEEL
MQAKKRYLLVSAGACALLLAYAWTLRVAELHTRLPQGPVLPPPPPLRSYLEGAEHEEDGPLLFHQHTSPRERRDIHRTMYKSRRCRMETCFDFSRCRQAFRVYVHPLARGEAASEGYRKVLAAIEESRYRTHDPAEACLFVLGVDTLDRDRLSPQYVPDAGGRIRALPLWNEGRNHLVFNLYSGTWPDYGKDLCFDAGHAMLAKGSGRGRLTANDVPPARRYLLVFKGKRYLTGIGSETRNALHHVHNGDDVILLTTCALSLSVSLCVCLSSSHTHTHTHTPAVISIIQGGCVKWPVYLRGPWEEVWPWLFHPGLTLVSLALSCLLRSWWVQPERGPRPRSFCKGFSQA